MEDVYDNVKASCLMRADGNQKDADYIEDCSYFDYYYRIIKYNEFVKNRNEAIKNATK